MTMNFMKFRSLFFIIIAFAAVMMVSCEQEEPVVEVREVSVPTGIKLQKAEQTTLTFAWDELNVDYYVVRLEDSDGGLVTQTSVKANSVTFRNLTPDTEYSFKVRSKVGNEDSEYSEVFKASTLSSDETPDPGDGSDPGDNTDPLPEPSETYKAFKIPEYEDAHGKALAFPGAEGGGMYTTGGRGGKVIHVTTLADRGTGSLRAALAESGTRTIVFDVAGIIELESVLSISNGNVTIAGQTAPGDGICIKNFSTQLRSDNVIIRFVRFRMGDEKKYEGDAIWGRYFERIILDHCSMSWSTDECSSFYGNEFFTMQWCILTESLCNSVHGKGSHGYGGIWGGKNASFHHNMLANHKSRNPRFDHPEVYQDKTNPARRGHVDYRNNAVYNWGDNSSYGGEGAWFNIVNNYYKPGKASRDRKYFLDANGIYTSSNTNYGYPYLYVSGNVHTKHSSITDDNSVGIYWHDHKTNTPPDKTRLVSELHSLEGSSGEDVYTTTHSAADAFERILNHGGASLRRDSVDERACKDARNGTATITDGGNGSTNGIIDTQEAAGGWPIYEADSSELAKIKDSDGDGMPDWFEKEFGLNAESAADGTRMTLDPYGRYTNLEMYLHYLVRDIIEQQNIGGSYIKL